MKHDLLPSLIGHIGAVANYDIITIGGKRYSVNQVIDKVLIAAVPTKVYSCGFDSCVPKYTTAAGNTIGKVTSYLLPKEGRKGTWLELQTGTNTYVYVKNEDVGGSVTTLEEQGTKTVAQEIKEEAAAKEKEDDPISHYVKKLGLPVLLIGGVIYLSATFGKQYLASKLK